MTQSVRQERAQSHFPEATEHPPSLLGQNLAMMQSAGFRDS